MYMVMKKIAEARKQLKLEDQKKVAFIKKAYEDFVLECSKMDDDLNFIGHPEACKKDWLMEAAELEILEESEFNYLFNLMEITGIEDAMSVA